MKKGKISNHTILTLGFIFLISLTAFVIAQTQNPGHSINQISGIPNCDSNQVLTKRSNSLTCVTVAQSSSSLVFGDSFPVDNLNDFMAFNFQAKEIDYNSNTYDGNLNIAIRGNNGPRFDNIQLDIIGEGNFFIPSTGQQDNYWQGKVFINAHGKNINSYSGTVNSNYSPTSRKRVNLDLAVGSGGDGITLPIFGADENTRIKVTIVNRNQNNFIFEQISYGMRQYQNNWGNINDEFEFYMAK